MQKRRKTSQKGEGECHGESKVASQQKLSRALTRTESSSRERPILLRLAGAEKFRGMAAPLQGSRLQSPTMWIAGKVTVGPWEVSMGMLLF